MNKHNKYLLLFQFVKIINGYKKSIIIDLQNEKIYSYYNNDEFLSSLFVTNKKIVQDSNSFFIKKTIELGLGVLVPKAIINNFIDIEKKWMYPNSISNAIINSYNFGKLLPIINELIIENIKNIQIIINYKLTNQQVIKLINKIKYFDNIQIVFNDELNVNDEIITPILNTENISSIIIYSSTELKSYRINNKLISFVNNNYNENYYPINESELIINIPFYMESLSFNTYYNRKIIYNDNIIVNPYDNKKIKSLKEYKLYFNKVPLWKIKKDDIDICKDCEYRYTCFDRRIPKKNNDLWENSMECNYNPYIALWKEQEGWKSVKQWRAENPDWEEKAKANRATYEKEDCNKNLEEFKYFKNL